jgi:hypothetical protein
MKTISKDQLEVFCIAFHKHFRICDIGEKGEDKRMYDAITDLPDNSYSDAVISALGQAGIKVK